VVFTQAIDPVGRWRGGGVAVRAQKPDRNLITSSYLVGFCTGRAAGFAPLRIRFRAAWRHPETFPGIATELGLAADNIAVEEGNTDTAPYGLGTYGSRSTPVSGAATAMACRKIKAKAQMIAAYMLEVHDDDPDWDVDRFRVKGNPERFKTMTELAWAAYHEVPPGMEPGLEAVNYYDPPNFTFPFGAYICVVDVDVDTGMPSLLCAGRLRHTYQPDDHRGPGARWLDGSVWHRHGPGDPLRPRRQRHDRFVHGLFPADRGGSWRRLRTSLNAWDRQQRGLKLRS
jgi:Molybdopterin-binding domain of aldehyde dehydrogenase